MRATVVALLVLLVGTTGTPPHSAGTPGPAHGPLLAALLTQSRGIYPSVRPFLPASGARWYDLTGAIGSHPGNRTKAAFAYDPALGGELLFGGYNVSTFELNDTWLYANGTWKDLSSTLPVSPPARWGALLAWDPAGQVMVLFGGRDSGTDLNDTWTFNRAGWHPVRTPTAPFPRQDMVYGYDPNLTAVYVFGGNCLASCGSGQYFHDSWTYSDEHWTDISRRVHNAPNTLDYGAWDPTDGYFLGYGNATNCEPTDDRTFTFNGTNWSLRTGVAGPGAPMAGAMVYDGIDHAILVYGEGIPDTSGNCVPFPSTWTYAHGNWTNLTADTPTAPVGRCCATMAYDPVEKLVLLEGGSTFDPRPYGTYSGEVWSYPVRPLAAIANESRSLGAAPLDVTFSANVSGGDGVYGYAWEFGDGATNVTSGHPAHVFQTPDPYHVTVAVSDAEGRGANLSLALTVVPALQVNGSADRQIGPVPLTVDFHGRYSGSHGPFTLAWSFGDGGRSSVLNITHQYNAPGNYTAWLNGTDGFGDHVDRPLAIVVYRPLGVTLSVGPTESTAGTDVTWTAAIVGGYGVFGLSWSGLPAGCAASDQAILTCVPEDPGNYTVTVMVIDSNLDQSSATARLVVLPASGSHVPGPSQGFLGVGFDEGIGVAIVAGVVISLLILRARRTSSPTPESERPTEGEGPDPGRPP